MDKKRVVITGMGVTSCFGNDVDIFYDKLLAGESGVKTITHFECDDFPTRFAASITDFDAEGLIDKKQLRRIDRAIAYAMVSGKKALNYAGLGEDVRKDLLDPSRCGIIIGSGMGGMDVFSTGCKTFWEKGVKRMSPFFIPYVLSNMPGGMLAIDLGFMGPNYSISTACATGNHSIIAAANHIRCGGADLMISGGVEAAISNIGLAGFCACKALSTRNDDPTKASRPLDRGRDGFVMGEGCGVVVLESLEHALARGATIYAEYLGGGVSCDAYHMTEPRKDGIGVANCLRLALEDADVAAERVNFVNGHSTSTPPGDITEINALKQVIPDPSSVVFNATKSMIGHSLGAAGGIEAVAMTKAIHMGKVHPTINLDDPEDDLGFQVPTQAADLSIDVALSNSFGFGGHNAVIAMAPYTEAGG